MNKVKKVLALVLMGMLSMLLCCGGGGNGTTPPTIITYSISGTMSGAISQGVTINLSGSSSANAINAITDAGGNFSFAGLANGSYTITPSLTAYTFTPTSRAVAISNANATGINFTSAASVANWNIKQNESIIEISYGSGTDYPQYAKLQLGNSYLQMKYSANAGWGTSVILLPSFWERQNLYLGAPITATWNFDRADIIIAFTGTISSLIINGQVRISPPVQDLMSAVVSISVNGNAVLDNRPGEAFKPVVLSSMHVSPDIWDAQSAYVNSQTFYISPAGWIIIPTVAGKIFGLRGGTSGWKNNTPTIELTFDQDMMIAGWITYSYDYNNDNVGVWAASDVVIPSWQYKISAKP